MFTLGPKVLGSGYGVSVVGHKYEVLYVTFLSKPCHYINLRARCVIRAPKMIGKWNHH